MLSKLPSKVAAMVPSTEYVDALRVAGLSAKGPRFINFAELAALESLKVHALLRQAQPVQIAARACPLQQTVRYSRSRACARPRPYSHISSFAACDHTLQDQA